MQKRTIRLFGFLFVAAILVFVFFFMFPLKESLTNEIGRYDYLKKPSVIDAEGNVLPNKWSENTLVELAKKMDLVYKNPENTTDPQNELDFFYTYIEEEEAIFFINNGFWPINAYVKERLQNESIQIPNPFYANPITKEDTTKQELIDGVFPNRFVYEQVILKIDALQDPQPLAYKIFTGLPVEETVKPPKKEIGRYDYLKPTALVYDENGQLPNRWSDETHVKVNDFFKIDNTESLRDSKPFNPNSFFATEEEAFYLLEYGHWPINGYVEEKLREGKVEIPFLYPSDEESIKKYMNGLIHPNRFLYQRFIQPTESNEDLAFRIWYGITEPPTENTSSKMTVKKYTYDFLKPIETMNSDGTTTVNKWHPETMERVMQQLQINKVEMPTYDPSMLVHWFPYATETEAVFYINKGFWPINTYVKEKMKTMTLLDMRKGPNNITKEDIIKGIFPNRLVYALYIQQRESEEEPPRSYAYNVFMGTKKPPESGCAV